MATYAFLTTDSNRVEVTANNPRQAYKKAQEELKKQLKQYPNQEQNQTITKSFVTYNKAGFADYNWKELK